MPSNAPVLVIAGGSRGIGAATARLAGERGYDVAVNYRRDANAAQAVVGAVKQAGGRAIAIQGDMAREADIAAMVATVERELGRPTHFVHSSGLTGPNSRVEAVASETLRRNSRWLIAGRKPNRQVDEYMWGLTRQALMFLEKRAA